MEGNKVYCPEACVFVSKSTNVLFTDSKRSRGIYPIGVYKARGRYQARCSMDGKGKHLGLFDTPEEASNEYRKAKSLMILRASLIETDSRAKAALSKRAGDLVDTTF